MPVACGRPILRDLVFQFVIRHFLQPAGPVSGCGTCLLCAKAIGGNSGFGVGVCSLVSRSCTEGSLQRDPADSDQRLQRGRGETPLEAGVRRLGRRSRCGRAGLARPRSARPQRGRRPPVSTYPFFPATMPCLSLDSHGEEGRAEWMLLIVSRWRAGGGGTKSSHRFRFCVFVSGCLDRYPGRFLFPGLRPRWGGRAGRGWPDARPSSPQRSWAPPRAWAAGVRSTTRSSCGWPRTSSGTPPASSAPSAASTWTRRARAS